MKKVQLLAFILLIFLPLNAQELSTTELKEIFYDAEFFLSEEEYIDALDDYMQLSNNGYRDNAFINYRIGICYLNIAGQKSNSIKYLQEAIKNTSNKREEFSLRTKSAPVDAFLFLGNAYRVNNRLPDAISIYTKYKELIESEEEINFANQQINACKTAIEYMEKPLAIRFTNLGDSVNTASSNYKAVLSGDGKSLVYMNSLPFYDAVYFSTYQNGGWTTPINITPQIQSDGDQYVSCLSFDGKTLYLTREDAFNSDIYVSTFSNNIWTKSYPLQGENINTKFWESHASLSNDGKTLYFTSNRKGGSGNMDLYKSQLQTDGSWGKPVNLGNNVNTNLNEDTPFITENDSILVFSSQGHENMGGYDIFLSKIDKEGKWSVPANIGYPINSTDDDLFFYPWKNAKVGILSRILNDTHGKEDIYAVQPTEDLPFYALLTEFVEGSPTGQLSSVKEEKEIEDTKMEVVPVKEETKKETEVSIVKEIELQPVYFSFDNFQLSEIGKSQLNKVIALLNEFKVLKIKITGHADAIGPEDYNLKLSERRAIAAKNYIVANGIETSRIETIGMGEKQFAAINSNPDGTDNAEGRKFNRRVECEVLGTEKSIKINQKSNVPEYLLYRK